MRFYHMCRSIDVTGMSGTGQVAEVIQFTDGSVVMRWTSTLKDTVVVNSTVVHESLAGLLAVHGHDGKTTLELQYADEETDGAPLLETAAPDDDWTKGYDHRELTQIQACRHYDDNFSNAGLPGHNLFHLVAKLVKDLEARS